MILSFSIDYRTNWGESLYLKAMVPAEGGVSEWVVKLDLFGSQTWKTQIELPDGTPDFAYRYFVRHENGAEKHEWGKGHWFRAGKGVRSHELFDRWQDQPWDKPYYSVVFTDCVCKRDRRALPPVVGPGRLVLSVDAPMIAPDEVVAVSGGSDALGNWEVEKAVVLSDAFFPTWSCAVPLEGVGANTEFKFLILKKDEAGGRRVVAWEIGRAHV